MTVTEHLRLPRRRESYVWPRDDADWYVEPTWCSIRLFAVESFVGHVHDPAAGMGRIVEAARAHGLPATGADIVDRSFGFMVQDFALATEPVDNIVTNPPFALARQFVDHALELARRKIAILFPIARLNAARWLEDTSFRQLWLLTPRPIEGFQAPLCLSAPPVYWLTNLIQIRMQASSTKAAKLSISLS